MLHEEGAVDEVIGRQFILTFSLFQFYISESSSSPENTTSFNNLIPTLSKMVDEVMLVLANS